LSAIELMSPRMLQDMRKSCELAADCLTATGEIVRSGIRTNDIDEFVHEYIVSRDAYPSPLDYKGFPKSVCTSVNDCVCHGIPGSYVLRDGDIVNVDVTSILDGYYADANQTFFVGTPKPDARKIVAVARECLRRGMAMVQAGNTVGDIGWAIQTHAESQGCSVVREFVGHGQRRHHGQPDVADFAEARAQAHDARVEVLGEFQQMLFLAVLAGHSVLPSADDDVHLRHCGFVTPRSLPAPP